MKVLFFVPPFPVNGDPMFFKNAAVKHLAPQANTLSKMDTEVYFAFPDFFVEVEQILGEKINKIPIPSRAMETICRGFNNVYKEIYADPYGKISKGICKNLREYIPNSIDVIFIWEFPAELLKIIYPDALIINQMPGFVSRPPYPHTVVFDPSGLYKHGIFYSEAEKIKKGIHINDNDIKLGKFFISLCEENMQIFNDTFLDHLEGIAHDNDAIRKYDKIYLFPLQCSSHYNFSIDVGYENTLSHLVNTLEKYKNKNWGILVTQYKSGLISDAPINRWVADSLSKEYDKLIYDESLDSIDNVSQYLTMIVDGVITSSSSLGIQALIWKKNLVVVGNTFIKPYETHGLKTDLSWNIVCDNVISFLISKLCPLSDKVVNDSNFLYNITKSIFHKHRKGLSGADLLCSFTDIDSHYDAAIRNSFRVDRALSFLSQEKNGQELKILNRFKNLANNKNVKAISFDLFDTLVRRSFEKPLDIWKFIENKAYEISNGLCVDFAEVRRISELEARNSLKNICSREEITIDDIYEKMSEYYACPVELLEGVKLMEIEEELKCIKIRNFGLKLYNIAKSTGKPIYILSDMYLPKYVILDIIKKCSYDIDEDNIFLSSDIGLMKSSGKLFDYFSMQTGFKFKNILHVGDNKRNDIIIPKSKGIEVFRWSAAIEFMRSNKIFRDIYHPRRGVGHISRSALAGVTASGMFDAPLDKEYFRSISAGDAFRLGYSVLGPLVTGFSSWIIKKAHEDNITDLLFFSREGLLIKNAYDILSKNSINSHYILASRRALGLASCFNYSDILKYASHPYVSGVPLSFLLKNRFGIDTPCPSDDMLLYKDYASKKELNRILFEYKDKILDRARIERNMYTKYISTSTGLKDLKNAGVVDIGWSANLQGYLGRITNTKNYGYYYITNKKAYYWKEQGHIHRSYAAEYVGDEFNSAVYQNRHFAEFLMCGPYKTFKHFYKNDSGDILPVYSAEDDYIKRKYLLQNIHNGAMMFVKKFQKEFDDYKDFMYIDYILAESAFKKLVQHPVSSDAKLFKGMKFEDAVGGMPHKYIICPKRGSKCISVWKQGENSLYNVNKNKRDLKVKNMLLKLERRIVRSFVNINKYNKYIKSRYNFFMDSRFRLVRWYGRCIQG